jgi:serine/threonine-protein kinase
MDDRWQQIEELYHDAKEQPPDQRGDFLLRRCGSDDALRREVESLLVRDARSGGALDQSAWGGMESLLNGAVTEGHSADASLPVGTEIGPYRITEVLGAGGMGRVYRADDTRLRRVVAVKVSQTRFSERFEREARALAALNHPNICQLYDVGPNFLIMEFVAGAPVAGGHSIRKTISIAAQIAEGLAAAHAAGLIHRDLKPDNILLTGAGQVKIVDFGLALAAAPRAVVAPGQPIARQTEPGLIIGTVNYMSPEQIRGQRADHRSDIFSFGLIVYEMLAGQRAFTGETAAEVMAAVLKQDPPELPESTPALLRQIVARCLEKDPANRFQSAKDLGFALAYCSQAVAATGSGIKQLMEGDSPNWRQARRKLLAGIAISAVAAASILAGVAIWRGGSAQLKPTVRFSIDLGSSAVENSGQGADLALSEDGTRLAYLVRNNGVRQIATRRLDQAAATVVPGTERASGMFLSPDGQWVGFFADGKMRKTPVQGGAVITLCDAVDARGAWWSSDGYIVASLTLGAGLVRLPDSGGPPEPLTNPALTDEATHRWPQVLPNGAILFTGHKMTMNYDAASVEVLPRGSKTWKVIQKQGYYGRYVPSGHLLYVNRSTLFAVPFDVKRLEISGTPVPLVDDVGGNIGNAAGRYEARSGLLVYFNQRPLPPNWTLAWLDPAGGLVNIPQEPNRYTTPRISPDGNRLASSVMRERDTGDIVVWDLRRNSSIRLTFRQRNMAPLWAPDGEHIVYQAVMEESVALRWVRADGAGETRTLIETRNELQPSSFSPDGRLFVFAEVSRNSSYNLFTMPLDLSDPDNPKAGKPEPLLPAEPFSWQGAVSPDGRWIVYSAGPSGRLYVRPFPPGPREDSSKWEIGAEGSNFPVWSRTRPELYFMQGARVMVVDYVAGKNSFAAGRPREWLQPSVRVAAGSSLRTFDLSPDGKRIVAMPLPDSLAVANPLRLTAIINFFDELTRRAPAR